MTGTTAGKVKELRDRTGVGMTKCKAALDHCNGDIEEAIAYLRKQGMASAVKKEGREAKEGAIRSAASNEFVSIVEVNAETDFVVNNDLFQEFLTQVAVDIAEKPPADIETLQKQPYSKTDPVSIEEYRGVVVQQLGENIKIRRFQAFPKSGNHSFGVYSHMGGKILAVVEIEGSDGEENFASELAMHVAAQAPLYVAPEDVPQEVKQQEADIARSQIQDKPANIQDKIIEGKLNKYFEEVCLKLQKFVKDDSKTIEELVAARAKETGKPLALKSFVRWTVGQ